MRAPVRAAVVIESHAHAGGPPKNADIERIGGVKYTIEDGIVYDAKQLLADVGAMVERQKRDRRSSTTSSSQAR